MSARQTSSAPPKRARARKAAVITDAENAASREEEAKEKARHQDRINRRRTQNRISQQCVREKAQAHAKQLQALTEMVKPIMDNDGASDMSSQKALMRNQLALIDENKELREALLQMRKKLLSLSSAAASVAEHPIFSQVLSRSSGKGKSKASCSRDPDANENDLGNVLQGHPDDGPSAPPSFPTLAEERVETLENRDMEKASWARTNSNLMPSEVLETTSLFQDGDRSGFSSSVQDQDNSMNASQIIDNEFSDVLFNDDTQSLLGAHVFAVTDRSWLSEQQLQTPIIIPPVFSRDSSATGRRPGVRADLLPKVVSELTVHLSQKIEDACVSYLKNAALQHSEQVQARSCDSLDCSSSHQSILVNMNLSPSLLAEVSKVGVYLMVRIGGQSSYVYGTGANDLMEKVFRWRCCPSHQNRMAIPEPFQPTTLQTMSMNHCNIIDFINWPCIRDQLIYKHGTYNMEQMLSDILLNTVVEIPQFQVAVNILDTFITRVFNTMSSSYSNSDIDFLNGMSDSTATPPAARYQELPRRTRDLIQNIVKEMPSQAVQRLNLTSSPLTQSHIQQSHLASKWGLYRVVSWKLSKEFAAAHPEMDCRSGNVSYIYTVFNSGESKCADHICLSMDSYLEIPHVQPYFDTRAVSDMRKHPKRLAFARPRVLQRRDHPNILPR
ncbi:hypothetical protein K432DRAFT_424234 [Lepidopterella palustris CBS 459.81]|uniref:BZIP domain-containing protein n=1 Tax=Lepidopterella palustris CBS 459.81 TaxID=1314670 RepID=A0A8E2EE49_9PEZI|nr:hypothetical protein K432DRAFT_424234 [Lepidopterella palustris CBS 459.81]